MKSIVNLSILVAAFTLMTTSFANTLPDSPAVKRGNVGVPDNNGAAISEAFESLRQIAEANGGSLNDIVKLDVYLSDLPKDFSVLNTVEATFFTTSYPARTVVGAVIPKNHTVEMNAIMVLPE